MQGAVIMYIRPTINFKCRNSHSKTLFQEKADNKTLNWLFDFTLDG